MVKHKLKTSKI